MFKELFTESKNINFNENLTDALKKGIDKILRNKAYDKLAVTYGDEIYFKMKDVKSAIRLKKAIEDYVLNDSDAIEVGGGAGDYTSRTVLDGAEARIVIRFRDDVPSDVANYANAKEYRR